MLFLFRINDPYRLILLLVVASAMILPYILTGWPCTTYELRWMLIGERLSTSDGLMYEAVWDTLAPLASFVYFTIHAAFGKSVFAYRFLGFILVFIQAIIFNSLLLKNKAFPENTYLPALFYVVFSAVVVDAITLSPVSLGLTFILLAINQIFKRIDNNTSDELFWNTGILMGIATLFYFPYAVYFLVLLLSLILLSSAIFRRIMLVVVAFILVLGISMLYYFYFDLADNWWAYYLASHWQLEQVNPLGWKAIVLALGCPGIITLIAIYKTYGKGRLVNFQTKFLHVFVFLFIGLGVILVTSTEIYPYQFILVAPIAAFFVTHHMLLIKKKWQAEVITSLILIMMVCFCYSSYHQWFYPSNYLGMEKIYLPNGCNQDEQNTILVLGDDLSPYCEAKLGSPIVNWAIAKQQLTPPYTHAKLAAINKMIAENKPSQIHDPHGLLRQVLPFLPQLSTLYESNSEQIWVIK